MKKFNTQQSVHLRFRMLCVVAIMLLASACSSVRFTYNHGDTILYWWLNAYLDLDSEQSGWVKKDIDELFRWHRKTQLKDYVQLLGMGQRQLAGNMTQADLLNDLQEVRARSELLAFKALPELADLARSVKPEQIAKLEKKFSSNNDTYRKKFMSGDTEKRQKVRYQKAMEHFELWFGSFSSEQEAILRKASDARPLDNEIWLEERMLRQRKIVAFLRKVQQEKLSKDATMSLLHNLIKDFFGRLESPERKAFYDAYFNGATQMILTAVKIATPAQKAHAQKRMQGWIEDFTILANDVK